MGLQVNNQLGMGSQQNYPLGMRKTKSDSNMFFQQNPTWGNRSFALQQGDEANKDEANSGVSRDADPSRFVNDPPVTPSGRRDENITNLALTTSVAGVLGGTALDILSTTATYTFSGVGLIGSALSTAIAYTNGAPAKEVFFKGAHSAFMAGVIAKTAGAAAVGSSLIGGAAVVVLASGACLYGPKAYQEARSEVQKGVNAARQWFSRDPTQDNGVGV